MVRLGLRPARIWVGSTMVSALLVSGIALPAAGALDPPGTGGTWGHSAVGQRVSPAKVKPAPEDAPRQAWAKPVWPGAGQARVQVTSSAFTRAGNLPISVAAGGAAPARKEFEGKAGVSGLKTPPVAKEAKSADASAPPSQVQVDELDAARVKTLGGVGIAFQMRRIDGASESGPVEVAVDYSGFAHAAGANFADRLKLVRLPGCALTRPDDPQCSAAPVVMPATNNPATGQLTAQLTAAPPAEATPSGRPSSTPPGASSTTAADDDSAPVDPDAVVHVDGGSRGVIDGGLPGDGHAAVGFVVGRVVLRVVRLLLSDPNASVRRRQRAGPVVRL